MLPQTGACAPRSRRSAVLRRGHQTLLTLAIALALVLGAGTAVLPDTTAPAAAAVASSAGQPASGGSPAAASGSDSAPPKGTAKRDKLGRYVSSPTGNGKPAPTPWAGS